MDSGRSTRRSRVQSRKDCDSLVELRRDPPERAARESLPSDQSVEHRFMLQVPGQYRGLLIGKRGATADAVRTMARTFVRSKSCFADIDVRVKRDV